MNDTVMVAIMMGLVSLALTSVFIISLVLGYKLVKLHLQSKKGTSKEEKATLDKLEQSKKPDKEGTI